MAKKTAAKAANKAKPVRKPRATKPDPLEVHLAALSDLADRTLRAIRELGNQIHSLADDIERKP